MKFAPAFSVSRWWSIVLKEFLQLKRDRVTFAMIVGLPIIQLTLFGYAIIYTVFLKRMTPQNIELFRKMWAEGYSTQKIADAVGTTKNGVVGKRRRLGLPERPSPIKGTVVRRISLPMPLLPAPPRKRRC